MQTEADIKYAAEMAVIVRLTNKTDFDFTPEMGAMYGGTPHILRAGESRLFPKPVAKHLAKHLARQTFIRNAPIRDDSQMDGKGKDRPLWGIESNRTTNTIQEPEVEKRAEAFLSDAYIEEVSSPQSEIDRLNAKIAELNKQFASQNTPPIEGTAHKDKSEIIAELEKRGIQHDKRQGKEKLEALLKDQKE